MKLLRVLAVAMVSTPHSPAAAVVSDGHEYETTCTDDGYRLDSMYPVTRMMGEGAGTHPVSGKETIYLGRSCDAYHKLYGTGSWCWANGGFLAEFTDHKFGFPRQELSCTRDVEYEGNCGC